MDTPMTRAGRRRAGAGRPPGGAGPSAAWILLHRDARDGGAAGRRYGRGPTDTLWERATQFPFRGRLKLNLVTNLLALRPSGDGAPGPGRPARVRTG